MNRLRPSLHFCKIISSLVIIFRFYPDLFLYLLSLSNHSSVFTVFSKSIYLKLYPCRVIHGVFSVVLCLGYLNFVQLYVRVYPISVLFLSFTILFFLPPSKSSAKFCRVFIFSRRALYQFSAASFICIFTFSSLHSHVHPFSILSNNSLADFLKEVS